MKEQLYIIKIGGNCIDDKSILHPFLQQFSALEGKKILIHGGGSIATKFADTMNIKQSFHKGRRITDKPTLDIAVMTYRGLINAEITAYLQSMNCNAIGLCGADAGLMRGSKRSSKDIDFGFVGDIDIDSVNSTILQSILNLSLIPIIAPIIFDEHGVLLNTNADTIAAMIAISMQQYFDVSLIFCFDKNGVNANPKEPESYLDQLNEDDVKTLTQHGLISDGMIPKLDNAFHALQSGVTNIVLTNPQSFSYDCSSMKGTRIIQ